jgi:hypothetical protein
VRSAGVDRQRKPQASKRRPNIGLALGAFWFFNLFFIASSCRPSDPPTPAGSQEKQTEPSQANASVPSGTPPRREKIWSNFDSRQALAEAKTLTDFGPRPSGSDANKQVRQHLIDRLTSLGWQTSEQRLTEQAPDGRAIEFCNLVARYSRYPASPQRILIGAHFDTPPTQEFRDLGASDGGANTAILIELARTLALDPQLAGSVELLFLDGNAPFRELNLNDGLFGSRFYTQTLRLNPNLAAALKKAATILGLKLEPANRSLLADQVPFAQAGIPSIALLDADSPFLHTADDTADRLDGDALAKTGNLVLYFVATERATP